MKDERRTEIGQLIESWRASGYFKLGWKNNPTHIAVELWDELRKQPKTTANVLRDELKELKQLKEVKESIQTEIRERGTIGGIPTANLVGLQRAVQIIDEIENGDSAQTPEEAQFVSRMANWKFHSAGAAMPKSLEADRQGVVAALSEAFGNCGWFEGKMGYIVAATVAWVIKDDAL